jgi:predicted DCC family thiol-disulfide oxidoreductase YuxK
MPQPSTPDTPALNRFKVFYDGLCVVCSREIRFYRRLRGSENLDWIDIASPQFVAAEYGLDPKEAERYFHVSNERGQLISGVDAFVEIWKRLPALKLWVKLSTIPGVKPMLKLGYRGFVRIRPYLPRHPSSCESDRCAKPRV